MCKQVQESKRGNIRIYIAMVISGFFAIGMVYASDFTDAIGAAERIDKGDHHGTETA